jgi:hybrid cluster-associated redox disulfide protein
MTTITKDMIIHDVLSVEPDLAQFLMNAGMGCMGCPNSRMKTLEQGCSKHGADVDQVVKEMNEYLDKR